MNIPFLLLLYVSALAMRSEDTTSDLFANVTLTSDQQATLDQLAATRDAATTKVETIRQAISSLDANIGTLQSDINSLNTQITDLGTQISQANIQQDAWLKEIQTLDLKINLKAQNEAKAQLDLIDTTLFSLTELFNVKQAQSQARIAGIQAEIDNLLETLADIEKSLADAQTQIDNYLQKSADKKTEIDKKVDYINNTLTPKIVADTAIWNKMKTELASLLNQVYTARAERVMAEYVKNQDKNNMDTYQLLVNQENATRTKITAVIDDLKAQIQAQQDLLDACEGRLKEYQTNYDTLTVQYAAHYEDYTTKLANVTNIEKSLAQKQTEMDSFDDNTMVPDVALLQTEKANLDYLNSEWEQLKKKVIEAQNTKAQKEIQKAQKLMEKDWKIANKSSEVANNNQLTSDYETSRATYLAIRSNLTEVYNKLETQSLVYQAQKANYTAMKNNSEVEEEAWRLKLAEIRQAQSEKNAKQENTKYTQTKKRNELVEANSVLKDATYAYDNTVIAYKSGNAQEATMTTVTEVSETDSSTYQ